jgi:hypothetical protein
LRCLLHDIPARLLPSIEHKPGKRSKRKNAITDQVDLSGA